MTELVVVLLIFLSIKCLLAFKEMKQPARTPEGYFLAGRSVHSLRLFFTFVATNFSAFFFMGFAGAGYRIGLAYYAMICTGTVLSAFFFFLVGIPTWKLSRETGAITPPELLGQLSGSRTVRLSYLFFMVLLTIPYLALQPIGAGYLLESLSGGQISYFWGAASMTAFIAFYVFLGGMNSVIKTDLFQGILMFLLMTVAVVFVVKHYGGLQVALNRLGEIEPALFTLRGNGDYFSFSSWASFMLLWLLSVPMFPQLFTRFFISKDIRSIKQSAIFYSIVPVFLFLFPVLIGMLGHIEFPGLVGKQADQILPEVLKAALPSWLVATIMMGALAAFMSTLDSQLLALSTMITHDVFRAQFFPKLSHLSEVRIGRWVVVALATLGLLIALNPPGTIFGIAKQAFTGFALLFPPAIALLHFKRVSIVSCVSALWVTEFLVFAKPMGIPLPFTIPSDPLLVFVPLSVLWILIGQILFVRTNRVSS